MIHLVLPETEAGKAMAQALLMNGLATMAESDSSLQLASADERMKLALERLSQEKVLVYGYDYVWIMRYLNEKFRRKPDLYFNSVKSYLNYVITYMGDEQIACLSTLSLYYSYGNGRFPEWTFSDTQDATERLRRVNIVKRFIVFYTRGC